MPSCLFNCWRRGSGRFGLVVSEAFAEVDIEESCEYGVVMMATDVTIRRPCELAQLALRLNERETCIMDFSATSTCLVFSIVHV